MKDNSSSRENDEPAVDKENQALVNGEATPKRRGRKRKMVPADSLVHGLGPESLVSVEVVKRGRKKAVAKEETRKVAGRKERILHFLSKDQFQILYPDLRSFKSRKHAVECLLPYHLLQDHEEEALEDREVSLDVLDRIERVLYDETDNIVLDILRCEEMKYLLYRTKKCGDRMKRIDGVVKLCILDTRIQMKVDEEML